MAKLKLITGEVDCDEFQDHLYHSRGNLLSLMRLDAEDVFGSAKFQNCHQFLEFPDIAAGVWRAWVAAACVGQYSLIRKCSVGAVARLNFYCRLPTREESRSDKKHGIKMPMLK